MINEIVSIQPSPGEGGDSRNSQTGTLLPPGEGRDEGIERKFIAG